MLRDGSKTKIIQGSTKSTERTRKRLENKKTNEKPEHLQKEKST